MIWLASRIVLLGADGVNREQSLAAQQFGVFSRRWGVPMSDGTTVRLAVKLSLSSLSGPVPLFPVGVETTDGVGKKDAAQKFVQQPNVAIMDMEGRERAVHRLPYGAYLLLDDGAIVSKGDRVAEWDPFTRPILTEVDGIVAFEDVVDGVTVNEATDEATGITNRVIIEGVDQAVAALLQFLIVMGYMFWLSWQLTLVTLIPLPFIALITSATSVTSVGWPPSCMRRRWAYKPLGFWSRASCGPASTIWPFSITMMRWA